MKRTTVKMNHSKRIYDSPLRKQQAVETREHIITIAKELFLAQGYPSTTIQAIALEARVSSQTVYACFSSKTGILLALLEQETAEAQAEPETPVSGQNAFEALVQATLQATCGSGWAFYRMAAGLPDCPELRDAVRIRQFQERERLSLLLRQTGWTGNSDEVALIWLLTRTECAGIMADIFLWSPERYSTWVCRMLVRLGGGNTGAAEHAVLQGC